jgi:hypothetical protein
VLKHMVHPNSIELLLVLQTDAQEVALELPMVAGCTRVRCLFSFSRLGAQVNGRHLCARWARVGAGYGGRGKGLTCLPCSEKTFEWMPSPAPMSATVLKLYSSSSFCMTCAPSPRRPLHRCETPFEFRRGKACGVTFRQPTPACRTRHTWSSVAARCRQAAPVLERGLTAPEPRCRRKGSPNLPIVRLPQSARSLPDFDTPLATVRCRHSNRTCGTRGLRL